MLVKVVLSMDLSFCYLVWGISGGEQILCACNNLSESNILQFQCGGVVCDDYVDVSEEKLLVFFLKLFGEVGVGRYYF